MSRNSLHSLLLCALLLSLGTGCTAPWREIHRGEGWTLLVQDESEVEIDQFETALDAGRLVVEEYFGPFEKRVKVYAWDGGARTVDGKSTTVARGEDAVQHIPGIGRASVRGFHKRGSGIFGDTSGVRLGAADIGLAVHELVHARIAECAPNLPLWLEEGFAMVLGDGALFEGYWQVDGLACWPLRELSEESLNDAQLELLLTVKPGAGRDMRTSALLHFLGWAIVFDLYRESGSFDWQDWSARYSNGISTAEARTRMNRTLHEACPREWLARLDDPSPAVRFCCARGLWKLQSREVAYRLYEALRSEDHPEVAAALSLNLLATTAAVRIRRGGWRMSRIAWRVLRDSKVEDPLERKAMRTLYEEFFYDDSPRKKRALGELGRFLEE